MNLGGTIRLNRTGLCIIAAIFILLMLYITSTKNSDVAKPENEKEASLKNILITAIEAARRGGTEITNLKGPLNIKIKGKTKEGVDDSVTRADFLSHCAMYYTLKQTFPLVLIISEEDHECEKVEELKYDPAKYLPTDDKLSKTSDILVPLEDIVIWIDPLDATKEYTENLHQYVTTMVCVAVKGKPIIGVIHKPYTNKTSWAWVDKVTSEDLHKPEEQTTDKPKVIISLSHAGEAEKLLKLALGENVEVITAGGSGYKSLEVTSGNVTAYYHTTSIKKWDICAGNAILNALGGKMTTSFSDEIYYSSATTGKVVVDKGLLATMYNHDWYIDKLSRYSKGN